MTPKETEKAVQEIAECLDACEFFWPMPRIDFVNQDALKSTTSSAEFSDIKPLELFRGDKNRVEPVEPSGVMLELASDENGKRFPVFYVREDFRPYDDEKGARLIALAKDGDALATQVLCLIAALYRGGPGCLHSLSASISGASAGVRLPCGLAAG